MSLCENCGNGVKCSVVGDVVKVESGCDLGSRNNGVEVVGPSVDVPFCPDVEMVGFISKSWSRESVDDSWLLEDWDIDWCESSTRGAI
jgi:hypothetical protein